MRTQILPIPGFIDLQVNGHLGIDFSNANLTEADCLKSCRALLNSGTSAFLPTVVTNLPEVYEHNLPILADVILSPEFKGRLLGIHIEGPFISAVPGAVGAHNPAWVRPPDITLFSKMYEWSHHTIRMLTIAAELDGAELLARWASERGILVSIGHTLATSDDLDRLAKAGASSFTHLGNGLPHQLHKFNNPIWATLADDRYIAMMIGDGHHVPGHNLKSMIRAKGVNRSIIVSDAVSVAGLPPGRYHVLGNDAILEPSGRFYNPEIGYLVGSSYTLTRCMNYLASLNYWSADELTQMGFYNPLRLLGIKPDSISSDTQLQYNPERKEFSVTPRTR